MYKRINFRKMKPSSLIIVVVIAILSFALNKSGFNPQTGKINQEPNTGLTTGKQKINLDDEYQNLAKLDYDGKQELVINNNDPNFTKSQLSTSNGSWQEYSNLDSLGRATVANALLNKNLMPTGERERLYVNPTAYQHKQVNGEWLYNRSHLIGYQLTGQNNNLKNLMTGTRSLNSPGMNHYEMDIAYFIKNNPDKFVRYQVRPIFRGNELLARGVQMKAQSVDSDAIHLNIYIFNVQNGVKLDYSNGNSQLV